MTNNSLDGNDSLASKLEIYDNYGRCGGAYGIRNERLIKYKTTLQLTEEQRDILIGTLLGDSSFSQRNGLPHYSIKFEYKKESEQYVHHLFEVFYPFVGTGPRLRSNSRKNGALWFRTIQHDSLKFYCDMFYDCTYENNVLTNKVKIVPKNIKKFLTPRALAYWFMDDGTFERKKESTSYIYSTQGFTKDDCEILRVALKIKYDIESRLHQDSPGYKLYILRKDSPRLLELIKPYILDCFKYKI